MKIKNPNDYIESLKSLNTNIFVRGEKIKDATTNPLLQPHINCAAMTYGIDNTETKNLLTATSHLTGKIISRFTYIHQSIEDLILKVKMMRVLGEKTGSCFQRCVGFDGLNALYSITYEIDAENNTEYHKRFVEYLKFIQEENIMVTGAMTDPKGDRSLRPSQQKDKDMFVRVIEQNKNGIIIRGAKLHQTGAVNSHEILVMPTTALTEEEKEYAISCAIPINAKGVILIFGRQTNDARRLEEGKIDKGNFKFGIVGGEATIILDDVFVPWERVFLCGETKYSGLFVERFASYHRQNYGGCKVGVCDVIIGAATLMAQIHGLDKASHIREKITEMIQLSETLYSCSLACSMEGTKTSSGAYVVNPLLANVVKLNATRNVYEVCRLAHDIAGGFIATLPTEIDMENPEISGFIEKYFKGGSDTPTLTRIKLARLIENMTGGTALIESMHGAGSPQAQKLMILRNSDLKKKIESAKNLIEI